MAGRPKRRAQDRASERWGLNDPGHELREIQALARKHGNKGTADFIRELEELRARYAASPHRPSFSDERYRRLPAALRDLNPHDNDEYIPPGSKTDGHGYASEASLASAFLRLGAPAAAVERHLSRSSLHSRHRIHRTRVGLRGGSAHVLMTARGSDGLLYPFYLHATYDD